jgi:predicted Fe-Mo cluster-binding NifX family protein
MKIAIPCKDNTGFDSQILSHFGRARYFFIAEVNEDEVKGEVVELPFQEHRPGDIPRFLNSLGVDTIIAYGLGMRAQSFFAEMGIRVISGASGKVRDVIDSFTKGNLEVDRDWDKREGFHRHEGCGH